MTLPADHTGVTLAPLTAGGLKVAQDVVTQHHYLHKPVDVRSMPERVRCRSSSRTGRAARWPSGPRTCASASCRRWPVGSTTFHMAVSVRGLLKKSPVLLTDDTEWITRTDGTRYSEPELREALLEELAQGHELLPMQECPGFDFKSGCPGHRQEDARGA